MRSGVRRSDMPDQITRWLAEVHDQQAVGKNLTRCVGISRSPSRRGIDRSPIRRDDAGRREATERTRVRERPRERLFADAVRRIASPDHRWRVNEKRILRRCGGASPSACHTGTRSPAQVAATDRQNASIARPIHSSRSYRSPSISAIRRLKMRLRTNTVNVNADTSPRTQPAA